MQRYSLLLHMYFIVAPLAEITALSFLMPEAWHISGQACRFLFAAPLNLLLQVG